MNDLPFEWEAGEVEEQAYVEIDGVKHYVTPTQYADGTSLSAYHLNKCEYETLKRANGTILWENPNPTAEMSANTEITLSSNDYDMLLVVFSPNINVTKAYDSVTVPKGANIRLCSTDSSASGLSARNLTYVSDTTFTAGSGYLSGAVQERRNVPLYIIGYKTGLFGGQS